MAEENTARAMMVETYFELEKVRFYRYRPSKEIVIAESQNLAFLISLANDVKIREGKTFGEKVTICERDRETDDVLDYPYIRYVKDRNHARTVRG